MLNQWNWEKTTTAIGLILSAVGIVVAIVTPEIRCLIPIINQNCPKGHCKSLFKNNQRIEAKYNRTDLKHLEFGEVENLEIIERDNDTLVTGIVYLLDHPYPGNKNLEQISVTSGKYTHKFPNPVRFQINYNKNDTWDLDWYDVSGTKLVGKGQCQNAKIATGRLRYPDGHHTYNIIFEPIQQ
ncbi:MAG: hypothetical protein F6K63_23660 [Moorea sp. SIO1G6]|uniref:hypothetical protein n=1 Tax=Moorena sp. SIO1G6 TaxID=2607840 RepID=UPI0013C21D9D|nr:hypothetical protein [Moorena sp. SIO1G6]NET67218.1 hypothetical protein [Moorena sp. SIO1G6]